MTTGLTEATLTNKALLGDHSPIIMPVTLAVDATARAKGTVMGKVTSSGHYAIYDDDVSPSDGTEVARVILAEDVDAHASATVVANVIVHGDVMETGLTGLDDNGKADLYSAGIFVK